MFVWYNDSQPWAWALEKYIFEKSGKNQATDLAVSKLRGSTIAIISAHVQGQHMWASAGPGLISKFSKTVESDGSIKIYNSVSTR